MAGAKSAVGAERLARSLDQGSSHFLFGYYLRALEHAAGRGPAGEGAAEAMRLLGRLQETASRCEALGALGAEIGDVARLVEERTGAGEGPGEAMTALLSGCARRWFQRMREAPKRRNSLAVDIAFNLELAGMEEVSACLYEAIICLEAGAFRASRMMSRAALEAALDEAGAPAGCMQVRMDWARREGLVSSADLRSALVSFGRPEDGTATEDREMDSAGWALETAHRLARKLLGPKTKEALLRAAGVPAAVSRQP
jgi:hypothetical protein